MCESSPRPSSNPPATIPSTLNIATPTPVPDLDGGCIYVGVLEVPIRGSSTMIDFTILRYSSLYGVWALRSGVTLVGYAILFDAEKVTCKSILSGNSGQQHLKLCAWLVESMN